MKIWVNSGTEEIVFCDHGRRGPSNLTPQVVRKKDVLTFVQAPFAKIKPRGNAYRIWSFATRISHETQTAAQLYLLTLHQTIPAQSDVIVELEDQATRFHLLDCCIEFTAIAPMGVLTTVTWTLTFGGMTSVVDPILVDDLLGVELNDNSGTRLTAQDPVTGELK